MINNQTDKGVLFIISAPSGAGKTTLCRYVRERFTDMVYSISYTTRALRPGDVEGADYYFITKDEFERGILNSQWAEWAEVHGNYYGTSATFLDRILNKGGKVLLDIDVQGSQQILKCHPQAVTIFIMPPSLDELRSRLQNRASDSPEIIAKRIKNAILEMEMRHQYRHIIVNDRLNDAVERLLSVIERYYTDTISVFPR
ncbi:guanylate kinase [Desulfococcaceae bacterium HSG9]|nr:guanylate kinase [Desulfococcaceae bacterium HSG9]